MKLFECIVDDGNFNSHARVGRDPVFELDHSLMSDNFNSHARVGRDCHPAHRRASTA